MFQCCLDGSRANVVALATGLNLMDRTAHRTSETEIDGPRINTVLRIGSGDTSEPNTPVRRALPPCSFGELLRDLRMHRSPHSEQISVNASQPRLQVRGVHNQAASDDVAGPRDISEYRTYQTRCQRLGGRHRLAAAAQLFQQISDPSPGQPE